MGYLDAGASDDAHEEIGDDASHRHHQALHARDASEQHEHEVDEMVPPRMQLHHEVTDHAGHHGDQEQERE